MIVAILPLHLAAGLRRAEVPHVHRLSDVYHLVGDVHLTPGDLLIIDPVQLNGDVLLAQRLAASLKARRARCAFYTGQSPEDMRAVVVASVLEPLAMWMTGVDDVDPHFRHRVLRLAGHHIVLDTLEILRPAIEELPWKIASAVVTLFAEPERFFDARDLETASGLSRRSVDRHLVEFGFVTASRIIVAAKLLHAAARLQCAGTTVLEVSNSLGYSAHEVLGRQCLRVLGCRPSALVNYPADRLCVAIASFICPRACPQGTVVRDESASRDQSAPRTTPYSYAVG